MSFHNPTAAAAAQAAATQPRRLELSVNPMDGSLLTAPLTQVLLASTDALYSDLYNMAHGELDVVANVTTTTEATATATGDAENNKTQNEEEQQYALFTQLTKRERMSNLSFAQRRHELQSRLFQHGRSLQHVAALTAAAAAATASTSTSTASNDTLSQHVAISSRALQHARLAWMQADEAQDALYFFHAQLFPLRTSPHDVYGACDVLLARTWLDLPNDLKLASDGQYASSREATWSRSEVDAQWQMAVRDKLVRGEVGFFKTKNSAAARKRPQQQSSSHSSLPFRLSLRGGILKLTHGQPKRIDPITTTTTSTTTTNTVGTTTSTGHAEDDNCIYPLVALLTILNSSSASSSTTTTTTTTTPLLQQHSQPEWSLLSLQVHVAAKTGEFNHQLQASNRQRYHLHRLAARNMSREEASWRAKQQQDPLLEKQQQQQHPPARPLQALFSTAHAFLLSWQLELLSAQAQALRRGVWAAVVGGGGGGGGGNTTPNIHVTPVQFFEPPPEEEQDNNNDNDDEMNDSSNINNIIESHKSQKNHILGVMSISFWKVDDSYGPPSMGDLTLDQDPSDHHHHHHHQQQGRKHYTTVTNQLTLSIRAVSNIGICVSLSGAQSVVEAMKKKERTTTTTTTESTASQQQQQQLRLTVQQILEAACNPLALSVSDALLSATRLCAELKCRAVARALSNPHNPVTAQLPPWVLVTVERGSIAFCARIQYHHDDNDDNNDNHHHHVGGMPILFRLECDARTGSFVHVFSRQTDLLRQLACNNYYSTSSSSGVVDQQQEEIVMSEAMALRIASLPPNRRRAAASAQSSTGRHIRDAFAALVRSTNLLGQRTGVGGNCWDNTTASADDLRERAIQSACADVRVSLIKCCGLAALFGLLPLSAGVALGLDAAADIAGEPVEKLNGVSFLHVPPVSILLDQQLIETSTTTSDGIAKKTSYLDQTLFAAACSTDHDVLTIYPLDIRIRLDSPTSVPQRTSCTMTAFTSPPLPGKQDTAVNGDSEQPPPKRQKIANGDKASRRAEDIMAEAGRFARVLAFTVDPPE